MTAVTDNIQIRRVRQDQIHAVVGQKRQVADIGTKDLSAGIRMSKGKINGLLTQSHRGRIDIAADIASAEELGFNEGGAATGHRVQNHLARLRIHPDHLACNLRGKIAAVRAGVSGPGAPNRKRPNRGGYRLKIFHHVGYIVSHECVNRSSNSPLAVISRLRI